MPLTVGGADNLSALAQRLKTADKTLMNELRSNVKDAVRPLEDAIRGEARSRMPRGYGGVLSRSLQFRISQRNTARGFTVTMTTTAHGRSQARLIRPLDRGQLRHPLYGNRKYWYTTRVRPGFWSDPVEKHKRNVVRSAVKAVETVAGKVAG